MSTIPRDLELSRRRARLRDRTLRALAARRRASVGQLSADTKIRPSRVVAILEGAAPEYSRELSLVRMGAAVVVPSRDAREYAITALGDLAASRAIEN